MAAHVNVTFEKDIETAMKQDILGMVDQLDANMVEQLQGGLQ